MAYRILTTVVLLIVLTHQACLADDPAKTEGNVKSRQDALSQRARRLADCQKMVPIFKSLGMPPTKGKRWVDVDVGWKITGWLVDESPQSLLLLDEYGSTKRISRAAKKPSTSQKLDGPIDLTQEWVAKSYRDSDYATFCRAFAKDGLPNVDRDKEENGIKITYLDGGGRGRIGGHAIVACRYAYWALEQGDADSAVQFYASAEDALDFWNKHFGKEDSSLFDFVAKRETLSRRTSAVLDAHLHRPRMELLADWRVIAQIPGHDLVDEAKRMIGHYESLIADDHQWVEPPKDRVEKMKQGEKAAYWIYHLRDADATQMSQPGRVAVLNPGAYGNRVPHAAIELEKLGWDAIPLLIEHLDDPRPTRCQGHWRDFWPDSYHLLAYGDVCQQVFETITLQKIYEGSDYPIRDGKAKECKVAAQRWYDATLTKGGRKAWEEERAKRLKDNPFLDLMHRMP